MKHASIIVSAVLASATFAAAQDRPPVAPPERPPAALDPKACAPSERLQPGDLAQGRKPETTGENLSDKLARTDGVICPPNVDPGIKLPTPEVGKMPVIPPPGSPGGDPTVRPK
jgi:hypothetical protein